MDIFQIDRCVGRDDLFTIGIGVSAYGAFAR
ncbi:Uncharacterised protein [Vibrio cholerae]|nr:Uncharacterised protein [Vibrio cholerae]CSC54141.1 Uncharacterised protein [Vibrio cholerae]CSH82876.1 Uncharacterised protein [Vibrio cholerae]